jgi:hypothetical protein
MKFDPIGVALIHKQTFYKYTIPSGSKTPQGDEYE